MKIINKLITIFGAVGALFSAIFYVLFKQKKDENNALKKEVEAAKADKNEALQVTKQTIDAVDASVKVKKEYEEELQIIHSNSDLHATDAGINLLHKLSEKGRARNKSN